MSFIVEPLEHEKILSEVCPKNRSLLRKLDIFDTIASTNSYLLECAKLNLISGHAVVADQQTAGRGRQGKSWVSPPRANIYFSLLWRFDQLKVELSSLAIAVAVIVARVLVRCGIKQGIQLKWPNDVLFENKKLAGILLESNRPDTVVIGIGINFHLSPEQAISVCDIIRSPVQRNQMIGILMNELLEQLPVFETKGLTDFIKDWSSFDYLLRKNVTIYTSHKKISGIMAGINKAGELLLEGDDGSLHTFCYGTVSVRRSSSDHG